jgi:hypothetical protein
VNGHHFANLDLLRSKGVRYPFGDKQAQTIFVEMLQLTTAAQREMLAWRRNMMRAMDQAARWINNIAWSGKRHISAICSDAITARGHPDNLLCQFHTAPCP